MTTMNGDGPAWWITRRHSCGHLIDTGLELETHDYDRPTSGDMLRATYTTREAEVISAFPCPWCGGESGTYVVPESHGLCCWSPNERLPFPRYFRRSLLEMVPDQHF